MEMKRRGKSISGLFLRFAVLFCINTAVILLGGMLLLMGAARTGFVLPANYTETRLTDRMPEIKAAGDFPDRWLPDGAAYGIYSQEGDLRAGNFDNKESEAAWDHYKNGNTYASAGNYYRFIKQDNGNICIVKYDLYMKYSRAELNEILPAPEILSFVVDGILIILNVVFLSRHFAGRLNRELGKLEKITEKIAENNLEFETSPSDIREISQVMGSFCRMKDALKASLTQQWDMERQKQEQLASLTHDIKTPLTIIKGNAELLAESPLSRENKECADYILSNAGDIERYLGRIKEVLNGSPGGGEVHRLSCSRLGAILHEAALQVAAAEKLPAAFDVRLMEGEIDCCPENILRAWKNILSNAAEYTDKKRGIEVSVRLRDREDHKFLEAVVRDYGPGFSPRDLKYADQEFYSGDASRHNREHQGLGLAIARNFLKEQGGWLELGNHSGGAEVRCRISVLPLEQRGESDLIREL